MGVHFAPVTSHPKGMYVPVHCFFTDSQLCRHRSFTTHRGPSCWWGRREPTAHTGRVQSMPSGITEAHPADGAGRSQLHTQEQRCKCPQPLRHHMDLWQSCQPDCRVSHSSCVTAFCWSPTSCHGFLLVTNKLSQLSAGHQHNRAGLCRCAGHNLFPQNTTAAKTLQMPKHYSCQITTLQLPKHHSCQNTADAKTPQMPKHHICQNTSDAKHHSCQNTTDAKTLQMPKHHRCQMVWTEMVQHCLDLLTRCCLLSLIDVTSTLYPEHCDKIPCIYPQVWHTIQNTGRDWHWHCWQGFPVSSIGARCPQHHWHPFHTH